MVFENLINHLLNGVEQILHRLSFAQILRDNKTYYLVLVIDVQVLKNQNFFLAIPRNVITQPFNKLAQPTSTFLKEEMCHLFFLYNIGRWLTS